jgi:hydroxyisourate hydrolase
MTISTHVLDTAIGRPAAQLRVQLVARVESGGWHVIFEGETNADGRIPALLPYDRPGTNGEFRLSFDVASYFARLGVDTFYTTVAVEFVARDDSHYHVPLLISPYGYSTYRGT